MESVVADFTDVWPVEIPYASIVEQMSSRRLPLAELPRAGKALAAYRSLWDHAARTVGVGGAPGPTAIGTDGAPS